MSLEDEPVVKEFFAIKRLSILALSKTDMTQSQLAIALDMDRSTVSRMFPKGTFSAQGNGAKKDDE